MSAFAAEVPAESPAISLELIAADQFATWSERQDDASRAWIDRTAFKARAGQFTWLPDGMGRPDRVVAGYNGSSLDRCNGKSDGNGGYAYYATRQFPYFMACYYGTATRQQ